MTKIALKEAKRIVAEAAEKDRQRRAEREAAKECKREEARQRERDADLAQIEPYETMELPRPKIDGSEIDPFSGTGRLAILSKYDREKAKFGRIREMLDTERSYAAWALEWLENQLYEKIVPNRIDSPTVANRIRAIIRAHLIRSYPRLGRGAVVSVRDDGPRGDGGYY